MLRLVSGGKYRGVVRRRLIWKACKRIDVYAPSGREQRRAIQRRSFGLLHRAGSACFLFHLRSGHFSASTRETTCAKRFRVRRLDKVPATPAPANNASTHPVAPSSARGNGRDLSLPERLRC